MKLVYSKTANLVAMIALLCMLVLPYIVPANVSAINSDQGLGSPETPTLVITKTDADGKGIAGVEFTIQKTHSYDPSTGKFTPITAITDGKILTGTTNNKGQIEFSKNGANKPDMVGGLELGRYIVKETKVPAGIVLNPNVGTVDIPTKVEQATGWDYKVEIYSKVEYLKGSVELTKTDENQGLLPDAQFELYKKGANGDTKIGDTYTTNENGKITVKNLDQGDYYFVETQAPNGYVKNSTKIEFSVTKAGEIVTTSWVNYTAPTITKKVEEAEHFDVERDTNFTYTLTVDLPSNIEQYKEFTVTDTLDSRLTYAGEFYVTGANGTDFNFASSKTGDNEVLTWTVRNTSDLKDLDEFTISFEAKIKEDAQLKEGETGIPNVATLKFNNGHGEDGTIESNKVTVKPTDVEGVVSNTLKVIKVDADDHDITLVGAEFKLTTDKAGEEVVNAEGTAIKVNGEQATGELVNLLTDENGEIVIEGLTAGTYYLHETSAPTYRDEENNIKSYKMLTAPVVVELPEDGGLTEVTVENSKPWDLPSTGGLGTVLFTVTGLGLMLLALMVLKRRKNEPTNV